MTSTATYKTYERCRGTRDVRRVAETFRDRPISGLPQRQHSLGAQPRMNINDSDWKQASSFFLVDPGPDDRSASAPDCSSVTSGRW